MDVSRFLDVRPAAQVLLDSAAARQDQVRYQMPDGAGGWTPLTWRQHADHVRTVAHGLMALGLQQSERAAIFAPNRVEWIEAALAIQAAGGVMVPVYASNTAEQLAYVVGHSDARVLFVDTPTLWQRVVAAWPQIASTVTHVVVFDASLKVQAPQPLASVTLCWDDLLAQGRAHQTSHPDAVDHLLANVSLDDFAIMLYTSGTSGQPKGVPLTHRNIGINGRDWLVCNGPLVEEGDVDLLWLPMSHIFGYGEACLGNTLGFTTYLTDPASVMGLLPVVRPHVFMSVPSVWDKLASTAARAADPVVRLRDITGGRLRFCLSGGAGLQRSVKETFLQAGMLIIEGYGLTETSPTLTLNRPDAYRFDSVGKPLASVQLKLADDGEILARGPTVFTGYHKDPAATAAAFDSEGWLLTGDIGQWTEDGFLQIIDRKKDILVTAGGKNIPPANIELRFVDEPLIAHAVVYGDGKSYLVAGIWLNPLVVDYLKTTQLAGLSAEAVQAALVERVAVKVEAVNAALARHETIKKYKIFDVPLTIEDGHLTPTLKVRRKRVYDAFRAAWESLYATE